MGCNQEADKEERASGHVDVFRWISLGSKEEMN
jgi:hypothetical protein